MSHGRLALSSQRATRVALAALALLLVCALVPSLVGAATTPEWDHPPTPDEYALLALANQARVEASATRTPLVWNEGLGRAARYHSWDMATHADQNCFQHDSCDGENWAVRVARFYNGSVLQENIGGGGTPEMIHDAWMGSSGHRAAMLNSSANEFGYGYAVDAYKTSYATEDFGARAGVTPPAIPAAAVLTPRYTNTSLIDWKMLVNFYDAGAKTPLSVRAVYDGANHPLTLRSGTARNGTWAFTASLPRDNSPCRSVYFEVVRSDNQTFRWPASGGIAFGQYNAACVNRWMEGNTTPTTTATTTTTTAPPSGIPVVTIEAPATGAPVARSVTIRASAIDNSKVVKIELWIDGRRVYGRRAATLTRQWNAGAATVTPGPHTITVKAWDEQGNAGSSTITVQK
jgi:uncharacterized protein YkwD